jgi:hypothetical protein
VRRVGVVGRVGRGVAGEVEEVLAFDVVQLQARAMASSTLREAVPMSPRSSLM